MPQMRRRQRQNKTSYNVKAVVVDHGGLNFL